MNDGKISDLAIKAALVQNWAEAIRINQQILDSNREDVEALNRLAYAYLKSGNINCSKTTYKKVLKVDKYNPIALKNLKWLENVKSHDIKCNPQVFSTPNVFLEEPGKTKIVVLVDTAPARILCNIITAQEVFLLPKKHSVEIRDSKDSYLGALPDDLAHRLIRLMSAGNTYQSYIKNVEKNSLSIFIREIRRGKKFADMPSFPIINLNRSYTSRTITEEEPAENQENSGESY